MNFSSFFLFLFVSLCLVQLSTQDELENFVRIKMANYSTWLQANNFDPSPLASGPTSFQAYNNVTSTTVHLSNYGVRGHSGQMELEELFANLPMKLFLFNLNITENVTFFGDYVANGTMFDGSLISGNGTWSVQVKSVYFDYFTIIFEEAPSGFLNIIAKALTEVLLDDKGTPQVYFENLLENESAIGHEDGIRSALFDGLQQSLHDDGEILEHPIRTLFLKYWEEIFAETTLEDIRNTPPPNSTTLL